jgi:thioredoxin reductase
MGEMNGNSNGTQPLRLEILVVGGGITGLTTAIACREKGFNVKVLEGLSQYAHVSPEYPGSPQTDGRKWLT